MLKPLSICQAQVILQQVAPILARTRVKKVIGYNFNLFARQAYLKASLWLSKA